MNKKLRFFPLNMLTVAQTVVIGVLGVFLWLELEYDYGQTVQIDNSRHAAVAKPLDYSAIPQNIVSLRRFSDYLEISNRPLFYASRRKMEVAAEPQIAAPQTKEASVNHALKLNGVSISAEDKTALLWHQSKRRFYKRKAGESVDNWKIAEINSDSVLLTNNGRNMELKLRQNTK